MTTPIISLFRKLHNMAEPSGKEHKTSELLFNFLKNTKPSRLYNNVGGYGLIAVFESKEKGKTLLFRADMDAVFSENNKSAAHLCGHDGHSAILCGLADFLSKNPLKKGKVVLLFQPAEEIGEGAKTMLKSDFFTQNSIDYCFALHNLPGFPLGAIIVKEGVFSIASLGCCLHFEGKAAHASQPELALNPAFAAAEIVSFVKQQYSDFQSGSFMTICSVTSGMPGFGTSPANAELHITLRAETESNCIAMLQNLLTEADNIVKTSGIKLKTTISDQFPETINDSEALSVLMGVAETAAIPTINIPSPFRWSEDFGHFSKRYPSVLFGLGAGENCPGLHQQDYNFPEELIEKGIGIFVRLIQYFQQ